MEPFPDQGGRIHTSDASPASARRPLSRVQVRLVHRKTHAAIPGPLRRSRTRGRDQPSTSGIQVNPAAVGGRRLCFPGLRFPQGAPGTWGRPKGRLAACSRRREHSSRTSRATGGRSHKPTAGPLSERRERHLAGVPRSRPKWTDPEHVLPMAPKREVRQELFLERLARRPHDRTDDRRTSVDRAVPGAHAPPLVRRDAAQQENKIRTLCICLLPARLRRKAVAMGVRPGTVDGRVPQQTPLRTPRTLSGHAARDSPAGTHAHEPSRPRHVVDAPHLSPACDDPSRNEVGPGAVRSRPRLATDRPLRGAHIVARRRPRRADISPRRHATPDSR